MKSKRQYATTDGAYQPALDQALAGGGSDAPDIYVAEAAFILKVCSGDAHQLQLHTKAWYRCR